MVRVVQPGILVFFAFVMWLGVAWGAQRGGFRGGGGFHGGGGARVGGGFHGGGLHGMHGAARISPGIRGGVRLSPSHPLHHGLGGFVRPSSPSPAFRFSAPGFQSHPFTPGLHTAPGVHSHVFAPGLHSHGFTPGLHFAPGFHGHGFAPGLHSHSFALGLHSHGLHFFFGSRFFGFGTPFFSLGAIPITTLSWLPFTDFSSSSLSSGEQRAQPSRPSSVAPSTARPGILSFKDGTTVEVVDYWLHGDQVYYLNAAGVQGSVPIDRLDLPATQQLNRERNLPFVLESRP